MNIYWRIANYIARYTPSQAKILAYLEKKNIQNPEKILAEIGYDENMMLDAWMRTFINTSKSETEIRQKLLLKKFPKEKIYKKIETYNHETRDWQNMRYNITKNIENKIIRGKSKKILENEFGAKYPYFKEEIKDFLAEFSDDSALLLEVEKYTKKYNLSDKKDEQKFFAALMRKWFRYDEIKKIIKEKEEL